MGLLDGRVIAITGAGGGLGRAHARAMAEEGARLVINDLGTSLTGGEAGEDPAGELVDELVDAGAEAIANRSSVADPEGAASVVEDAVDAFGRLDGVVNNAGILRDKTIVKMDDEMWRAVLSVHLDGTFYVTRAAMRHFRDRAEANGGQLDEGGRIINTTSIAGLQGNFGQANYGAAKAGIAGLTRVTALEGRRYGVTANAIAPVAKTRMTDDIDSVPDEFAPEQVSPLVVWLASEASAEANGKILGAHGDHYFAYEMQTTGGVDPGEHWDPAEIGARFDDITELSAGSGTEADDEAVRQVDTLLEALIEELHDDGWEAMLQFEVGDAGSWVMRVAGGEAELIDDAAESPTATITFESAETLLAIARGEESAEKAFMSGAIESDNMQAMMRFGEAFDLAAAASALASDDSADVASDDDSDRQSGLNRNLIGKTYRGDARFVRPDQIEAYAEATSNDNPFHRAGSEKAEARGGPIAPPLFPVRPLHRVLEDVLTDDELNADLLRLVHGEQDMRFHAPLERWDLVAPRAEISAIEEKSSGELLRVHLWLMRAGECVCDVDSVMFIRSSESRGAEGGSTSEKATEEVGPPEGSEILHSGSQQVADDQPMRYAEASGDHNPIHTDPDVAEAAGLPGVILHGLCTMAFACNEVVEGPCGGDPRRLQRLKTRFSRPVLPGEKVETIIWEEGTAAGSSERDLRFVARNDDGEAVLTRGVAEVASTTN